MIGIQNIFSSLSYSLQSNFNKIPLNRTTKLALACLIVAIPCVYGFCKLFGRIKKIPKEIPMPLVEGKPEIPSVSRDVVQIAPPKIPECIPTEEDKEPALLEGAEKGDLAACHALLWIYRKDPMKSFVYQKKAADLGDTDAQIWVGNAYLKEGNSEGQENALSYYLKARKSDHPEANYRIGLLWKQGWSDRKPDLEQARQYFELAAEKGNGDAETELELLAKEKLNEVEKTTKTSLKHSNRDALRKKREQQQAKIHEGKENEVHVQPSKEQSRQDPRKSLGVIQKH